MADRKFPTFLDTDIKVKNRARELVEAHLQKSSTSAHYPKLQGMFSKTVIVIMSDNSKAVLQFRHEPLNPEPFVSARKALNDLVPVVEILHDQEIEAADLWPVYLSFIPGDSWAVARQRTQPNFNIDIMGSLGRSLSAGFVDVDGNASAIVQSYVLPKLTALSTSTQEEVKPFQGKIKELLSKVNQNQLSNLPLLLSHLDLNEMNIMVSENQKGNGYVTGIVDWELSPPPLPFGVNLSRLLHLCGEFRNGEYYECHEFVGMETAFWTEIVNNSAITARKTIEENWNAVQLGFTIGIILDTLYLDEGSVFNKPSLKALPKFLTYTLPALRGDDPPFAQTRGA